MSTFDSGGDLCLGFFEHFWKNGLLPELPKGARVLEIGCAEADWLTPMKAARPDLYLVGMDQRDWGRRPGADETVRADVLTFDGFPPASFDAIIAVSMVEWAGTGKYNDPKDPSGDTKTMWQARKWIKPDGWFYFDVPYDPGDSNKQRNPPMRVYDDYDFARLFETGWDVVRREYFSGDNGKGYIHPDGPYMAHLLRPQ
jgi:SAM-dependent methyltransferase